MVIALSTPYSNAQNTSDRMSWFKDAKLGIFIHWGIYSVKGIDESWSFFNGYISHDDYMKQLEGFSAKKYNPEFWATLIKESGARYAVLTSKHHDGLALWPSKYSDVNVVKKTPAQRDLIQPFCNAIRNQGLKVGLYYSILDWSHPDYPNFTRDKKRYEIDEEPSRWDRFAQHNFDQIGELAHRYNPDLWWFDGDWEQSAAHWRARELRDSILSWNPRTIINSRLQGHGDYATPEQGVPIMKPKDEFWELCMTMNNSWGYQHTDTNYKSSNQIIRIFIDCISMGGNLLLDIGPKADGSIPEEQVQILKDLGRWTKKHEEAIYGTEAGIRLGHFHGPTTLSRDKRTLYLFVEGRPNGPLLIKGLKNKVNRVYVVGDGTKLKFEVVGKQYWSDHPGLLYIDLVDKALDKDVTVVAVMLDGEVELAE